jgi:serine/threonine-protein kinase
MARDDEHPQAAPATETSSSASGSSTPESGGGSSSAPPPSWQGKRLGHFRLLALLGQGSMGKVFRAEDISLKRHVAIKVLPTGSNALQTGGDEKKLLEQFICEARAAATLEHPHVVQIYEVNQAGGVHYIAMELVEGGDLGHLIKTAGPLDVGRACQVMAEALDALGYAHQLGIVHRDVKPSNLMLARNGRVKLADFGLARIDEIGDHVDVKRRVIGTPQFCAPEVIRGQPADARSDIYSAGATMWFLLTGKPPFLAGTTRELLKLHLESPLPDLKAIRPDVPDAIVTAIATAMAKDPAHRHASAEQFASIMRAQTIQVGSGSLSGMHATGAAATMPLSTRTTSRRVGMLAGVGAAITLALVGVWWLRSRGAPVASGVAPTTQSDATKPSQSIPPAPVRVAATTTSPTTSPAPAHLIAAKETEKLEDIAAGRNKEFAGKPVTVEGRVYTIAIAASKKVARIEFEGTPRDKGFQCVYFPANGMFNRMKEAFGSEDASALHGKAIHVTGIVSDYQGRPQIVIDTPDQIQIR